MKEENVKMADVEMNAREWLRQLLYLAGYEVSVDDILFSQSTIVNESEIHNDIVNLVNSGVVSAELAAQIAPILVNFS